MFLAAECLIVYVVLDMFLAAECLIVNVVLDMFLAAEYLIVYVILCVFSDVWWCCITPKRTSNNTSITKVGKPSLVSPLLQMENTLSQEKYVLTTTFVPPPHSIDYTNCTPKLTHPSTTNQSSKLMIFYTPPSPHTHSGHVYITTKLQRFYSHDVTIKNINSPLSSVSGLPPMPSLSPASGLPLTAPNPLPVSGLTPLPILYLRIWPHPIALPSPSI